jgi:hypothetical protein
MSQTQSESARALRNLNPTPEAMAAMWPWSKEYAAQGGGSMDFWDKLPEGRKRLASDCAAAIIKAAANHGRVTTGGSR